jgi:hypothetical protein
MHPIRLALACLTLATAARAIDPKPWDPRLDALSERSIYLAQASAAPAAAAPAADVSAAVTTAQTVLSLSGPWAGRFYKPSVPSPALWQSVDSPDQVLGAAEPVWHLDKGNTTVLNLAVGGGAHINDAQAGTTPDARAAKGYLGPVVQVPGSLLDATLGTTWGQQWAPALKTGVLFGYNLLEWGTLHAYPGFVGLGVSYPVGGATP